MIYLDNAATSYPKPANVIDAQLRCMQSECGNAGRGAHVLAMRAAERIFECRCELASFFGAADPSNVIFTPNTTTALNFAIKGLLREGDHVLISDLEHNAVFRPIYKLAREGKIQYDVFSTGVNDPETTEKRLCEEIESHIRPETRMLICSHASNICSYALPLAAIGRLCRAYGILFVVDAAQSAGHLPIHVESMGIDALCAPGHKGLLGPQGSGFLLLGKGVVADTLIEGGSGYNSLEGDMPQDAPERYEAGTLATPAIAGLCAGVRTVKRIGQERISRHLREWNTALQEELRHVPRVTVYAPHCQGAILLFNLNAVPADHVGHELDKLGFCVRTGYHCAALGHATLKTPNGGAVRVSPGFGNTRRQVDMLIHAIERIERKSRDLF